jgi:hypothetical protein
MSYNHKKAVPNAIDQVLFLGKHLQKTGLSALAHPSQQKPSDRWRNDYFVIIRNESEEVTSDGPRRKIYSRCAYQLSGFMLRLTDRWMEMVLKNTEATAFFEGVYQILYKHSLKPCADKSSSASKPSWEFQAMADCITFALKWLGKVQVKEVEPDVTEELASADDFQAMVRRRMEMKRRLRGELEKELGKKERSEDKIEGVSASEGPELCYIEGVPGYLMAKTWIPQLNIAVVLTQLKIRTILNEIMVRKLDPVYASSALLSHYISQPKQS